MFYPFIYLFDAWLQVPGVQRVDKPPTLDKKGKVKVCGSTQTSSHDLHSSSSLSSSLGHAPHATGQVYSDGEYSLGRKTKHYGMINSPVTAGLHCSSPTPGDYARNQQQRLSISSEHSSPYNGVSADSPSQSHYAWLRAREAAASGSPGGSGRHYDHIGVGSLTEADSMESLSSMSNTLHAQLQHARANSLTHARLLLHQRELAASVTPGSSPRLTRSNSIRSTKSEKMYPSMLTRSEDVDNFLLSSAASVGGAPVASGGSAGLHGNNNSQPTSPSSQVVIPLPPLPYLPMHGGGSFIASVKFILKASRHPSSSHFSFSPSSMLDLF